MLGFFDLTFKAQVIVFTFLLTIFSVKSFAQHSQEAIEIIMPDGQTITLTQQQLEQASQNINENINENINQESGNQTRPVRNLLTQVKQRLDELKDNISAKKKAYGNKVTLKQILLETGKGASFISTQTARPFVNISGFMTGFFEQPQKNEDQIKYMNFYLKHEDKFSDIWQELPTQFDQLDHSLIEKLKTSLMQRVTLILKQKQQIITQDMIIHFSNHPEELTNESVMEFVNAHPQFADLKEILGDLNPHLNSQCLQCLEQLELFADPFVLLNSARITAVEAIAGFALKSVVPQMALSILSKGLASTAKGLGVVADLATVSSVLICSDVENVQKINIKLDIDLDTPQMQDFCQYVIGKSAYVISRSRIRGYVKGKKIRKKFQEKREAIILN